MEIFGLLAASSAVTITVVSIVASIAAPVFWLWMLIDALVREEHEYPGATATSSNRLLWALLIAFVQIAALPYYFVVYRTIRRGTVTRPGTVAQAC